MKDIDKLLKHSLSSTDAPSDELNMRIKSMIRERHNMRKSKLTMRIALITAAILAITSFSVFAYFKYLTPQEYAQRFEYTRLAEAFNSDEAIIINQTLSSGGYDITLLGTVFGDNLRDIAGGVEPSKTYAVVAIEKQNGTIPDVSDDDFINYNFSVTPLIKGCPPWHVNIFTMGGSSIVEVIDGVMYRLIECTSVEAFADVGVYIGVTSDIFCSNQAFKYDADTGVISANLNGNDVSVVFDLPLDKSKADPEAAKQFLDGQGLYNPDIPVEVVDDEQETEPSLLQID